MARRFAFSELAHARHSLSKLSSALAESQLLRSQGAGADIRLDSGKKTRNKKTRKQENKKTRKQNDGRQENKETRKQDECFAGTKR